ncbi:MAG TPA: ECF-type sigma factor [Gemmatimonadales bacterium]|nr:ECF-type sigma factor [Gemmatimonadales bacterium]
MAAPLRRPKGQRRQTATMTLPDNDSEAVTVLLKAWSDGDRAAGDRLFGIVYGELRRLARVQIRRASVPVTIQATEVIHEAYIRLAKQDATDWKNRAHFYAIAATVIRRVLLDYARNRLAGRRDRRQEVGLDNTPEAEMMTLDRADELIQLDAALDELGRTDARRARVVELRYFAGLGVADIATVIQVSEPTVKRDWAFARAWLRRRLSETGSAVTPSDD